MWLQIVSVSLPVEWGIYHCNVQLGRESQTLSTSVRRCSRALLYASYLYLVVCCGIGGYDWVGVICQLPMKVHMTLQSNRKISHCNCSVRFALVCKPTCPTLHLVQTDLVSDCTLVNDLGPSLVNADSHPISQTKRPAVVNSSLAEVCWRSVQIHGMSAQACRP